MEWNNLQSLEIERYDRNIIISEIGIEGQEKLLSAKVLIAGLGGVGSTVIANLASMGVGTLGIIDSDVVELSNLNRQYMHKYKNIGMSKVESAHQWIEEYNPHIKVEGYNLRLNEDNYKDIVEKYDFIIDCFDTHESMFLLNKIALEMNKPLVTGGCYAFGGFAYTIIPNKTPCLGCITPKVDTDKNLTNLKHGVISPTPSVIASFFSYELLKLVLGIGTPLNEHGIFFDGLNMQFKRVKCYKKKDCPYCSSL